MTSRHRVRRASSRSWSRSGGGLLPVLVGFRWVLHEQLRTKPPAPEPGSIWRGRSNSNFLSFRCRVIILNAFLGWGFGWSGDCSLQPTLYIHICIYVHTYIHIYIYTYVRICVYIYIYTHRYTYQNGEGCPRPSAWKYILALIGIACWIPPVHMMKSHKLSLDL